MGKPRLIIIIRHAQSEGNSKSFDYTASPFTHWIEVHVNRPVPRPFQKTATSTRRFPTIVLRSRPRAGFKRMMPDGASVNYFATMILFISSPPRTAVPARRQKESLPPWLPMTQNLPPSGARTSRYTRSPACGNRTLEIFSHVAQRWSACGRSVPITATSSTVFPTARVLPTPTTESAASTRVFGGSLARTISQVFAF